MHYKLQLVLLRTEQVAQKKRVENTHIKKMKWPLLVRRKGDGEGSSVFLFLCRDIFLKF